MAGESTMTSVRMRELFLEHLGREPFDDYANCQFRRIVDTDQVLHRQYIKLSLMCAKGSKTIENKGATGTQDHLQRVLEGLQLDLERDIIWTEFNRPSHLLSHTHARTHTLI